MNQISKLRSEIINNKKKVFVVNLYWWSQANFFQT